MSPQRRRKLVEVLVTTAVVLAFIRLVVALGAGVLYDLPLALVPVAFMWAPVWVMTRAGDDPDRYPLAIPMFADRAVWLQALRWAGGLAIVIGPVFIVGYHLWQTRVFPEILDRLCAEGVGGTCVMALQMHAVAPAWRWHGLELPLLLGRLVAYHVLFVGLPEELYYRGYMQSRLDEVWAKRWRVFGADLGPGWLVTCVLFALGHSVVAVQWWHIFIVFPSLIFGWLRARTGHVLAGAMFHAWCNVTVGLLDIVYGLSTS